MLWDRFAPFWGLWGLLPGLRFGRPWGALVSILSGLEVAWAPFWGLWGLLGSILGAPGVPWAPFWELWGSRGKFGGSLGAPLAAQGAQSQIVPLFSLPFWSHFGSILEAKTDQKSDAIFD